MDAVELQCRYTDLATAHVADACLQLALPLRYGPAGLAPLWAGTHVVGRVCPVRHQGDPQVILQAMERAAPGDVLLVDNGARDDEACVGDIMALRASRAGLNGIVIWGLHRDSADLRTIHLPLFSLGAFPARPRRNDAQQGDPFSFAQCGGHTVSADDFVLGDDDGVIFLPLEAADEVARVASGIRDGERRRAAQARGGS